LNASNRTQYANCAVEYAQGTLHFDRKVDVAGGIDDIDLVLGPILVAAFPETACRGRGDRNPSLLLLLHPVHGCSAIVYLTHFVRLACIKQDSLGCSGLTRINMSGDSDVSDQF